MIKNILASVAAAGLLVAPIAAQANTRPSDNTVSLSSLEDTHTRRSTMMEMPDGLGGMSIVAIIAVFGSVAAFLIWLVENGEDDASPGTGG